MNRVDRLHAILTVLQSKRVVKAEELATRFSISKRTVYRDLRALEEGGVPIGAEAGIGFFLSEGYSLPPVMFNKEEARSLLMAGKMLEKNSDSFTSSSFNNALTKIRAVLNSAHKDELESLDEKILVKPFPSNKPTTEDLNLKVIHEALAENNIMQIKYQSAKKSFSERDVEPLGLVFYYDEWHLIAFCCLRGDYRDFRLDRVVEIKLKSERFLRIKHPTIKQYMDKMIGESQLIPIVLDVQKDLLPYIGSYKFSMGLITEEANGDYVRMSFATVSLEYFARWILMIGTGVKIIEPEMLIEKVRSLLEIVMQEYSVKLPEGKIKPDRNAS